VRNVKFYKSQFGSCPIIDFIYSLSGKQAQKITWVLQIVEEHTVVPKQYFKKLVNTNDIWEVGIVLFSNIFRLLGFFDGDDLIILTNGFVKKSQKTPQNEIKLAEKRKKDYLDRKDA
jgi:phage-related protein